MSPMTRTKVTHEYYSLSRPPVAGAADGYNSLDHVLRWNSHNQKYVPSGRTIYTVPAQNNLLALTLTVMLIDRHAFDIGRMGMN